MKNDRYNIGKNTDCTSEGFFFTGPRTAADPEIYPKEKKSPIRAKKTGRRGKSFPLPSVILLSLILAGCLFCRFIMTKDPAYMDLAHAAVPAGFRIPFRYRHAGP